MTIDPFREVRDAVRPSAAAGHLSDTAVYKIATRHRVDEADVRRIYSEEHARLHPETAEPDTTVGASAPPAVAEDEPSPPAERAQASDMGLVSDALLAMSMLGDQIPDALRTQHGLALNHVTALHKALGDHHRNADLIAERAVLAARLAEIDQALAPVHDIDPLDTLDQAAESLPTQSTAPDDFVDERVSCPDCGGKYMAVGLPRHRAACRKKRGAA